MVSEGTKFSIAKDFDIEGGEVTWFSAQEIWELKNPGKNYHEYKLTHHSTEGKIGGSLNVKTKGNQQYKGIKLDVGGGITMISINGQIFFKVEKDIDLSSSQKTTKNLLFIKHKNKGHQYVTPKMCEILSKGGMIVHAKDGIILEVAKDDLGKNPATKWALDYRNNPEFMWKEISKVHKNWNDTKIALTPGATAVIGLAVGIMTQGTGAWLMGGLTGVKGAMASAAFTKIMTHASISLVNNKGDIGKTMQDLGSSQFLRSLASTIITAGLVHEITDFIKLPEEALGITENLKEPPTKDIFDIFQGHLQDNVIKSGVSCMTSTLIEGGDIGKNFISALKEIPINTIAATMSEKIGSWYKPENGEIPKLDSVSHKVLHGIVAGGLGFVSDEKDRIGGMITGAFSGAFSETLAEFMTSNVKELARGIQKENPSMTPEEVGEEVRKELKKYGNIAKFSNAVLMLASERNVDIGIKASENAIDNNFMQYFVGAAIIVAVDLILTDGAVGDLLDNPGGYLTTLAIRQVPFLEGTLQDKSIQEMDVLGEISKGIPGSQNVKNLSKLGKKVGEKVVKKSVNKTNEKTVETKPNSDKGVPKTINTSNEGVPVKPIIITAKKESGKLVPKKVEIVGEKVSTTTPKTNVEKVQEGEKISLKFKEGSNKKDFDRKVIGLEKGVKEEKVKVTKKSSFSSERRKATTSYRRNLEKKIENNTLLTDHQKESMLNNLRSKDVDHIIDLQLDGTNKISNLRMSDYKVNRSVGSQIGNQTSKMKEGTPIIEIIKDNK